MKLNELVKRVISSVIIIPIVILLVYLGSYYFIFFLFLCFTIATYEWTKIAKLKNYLIPGFIFIGLSFISAYNTRYITFYDYEGVLTFLFILLICILTDIGGYVFGKTLKGPKLTRISPNKTIAGFLGGIFLPVSVFYIILNNNIFLKNQNLQSDLTLILFFIAILSIISQLGDLSISYFKRRSGFKNTGNIIPGHGGILDRIDGMIFVFLFSYFYFLNLWKKELQF